MLSKAGCPNANLLLGCAIKQKANPNKSEGAALPRRLAQREEWPLERGVNGNVQVRDKNLELHESIERVKNARRQTHFWALLHAFGLRKTATACCCFRQSTERSS